MNMILNIIVTDVKHIYKGQPTIVVMKTTEMQGKWLKIESIFGQVCRLSMTEWSKGQSTLLIIVIIIIVTDV